MKFMQSIYKIRQGDNKVQKSIFYKDNRQQQDELVPFNNKEQSDISEESETQRPKKLARKQLVNDVALDWYEDALIQGY